MDFGKKVEIDEQIDGETDGLKNVVPKLIHLADELDKKDFDKEAMFIDKIINKIAQEDVLLNISKLIKDSNFEKNILVAKELVNTLTKSAKEMISGDLDNIGRQLNRIVESFMNETTDVRPAIATAKQLIDAELKRRTASILNDMIKISDMLDKKQMLKHADVIDHVIEYIVKR